MKRRDQMKEQPVILLVDDEENILASLSRLLRRKGFSPITVNNARSAYELVREKDVDLVISDYSMPDMNGLELMIKIRETHPDVIRIMLTAFGEAELMQKAINKGEIYRFLFKPWGSDEIVETVKTALERKQHAKSEHENFAAKLHQANLETVMALAEAIELKDPYTKGHCSRVRDMAIHMAKMAGIQDNVLNHLNYGALLHDCGKIGIDEAILLKPGRLSEDERKVIEQHPALGFDLVNSIAHLKEASIFIRQHHERWDGKGYPDGLSGKHIHICSRILSVADVFDALTSDRPYRKGMDISTAKKIMLEGRETQFDPEMIDLFISLLDEKNMGIISRNGEITAGRQPSVLFVNDHKIDLEAMQTLFKDEECRFIPALGVKQGLEILESETIDVVVSDYKMSILDGVDFMAVVNTKYPGIKKILKIEDTDLSTLMEAINKVNIYKLIMQPFDRDKIRLAVKNALEWKQMLTN